MFDDLDEYAKRVMVPIAEAANLSVCELPLIEKLAYQDYIEIYAADKLQDGNKLHELFQEDSKRQIALEKPYSAGWFKAKANQVTLLSTSRIALVADKAVEYSINKQQQETAKCIMGAYKPELSQDRFLFFGGNVINAALGRKLDVIEFSRAVLIHEIVHALQFNNCKWLHDAFAAEKEDLLMAMILIEGHATFVTNEIGPTLISNFRELDAKMHKMNAATELFSKFMPIGEKIDQYRKGNHFCKEVAAIESIEFLNKVWDSQSNVPTQQEFDAPSLWIERIKSQ